MKTKEFKEIGNLLSNSKKIVIVPHKNPDGDAIGSSLGMYQFLKKLQHKVVVIVPNDYPDFLKWIPGQKEIMNFETEENLCKKLIAEAEIIFTLDFNALHRAGKMESPLEQAKGIKIIIDHHQNPENYAKFTYSDVNMCSTCEMVYHFIDHLGKKKLIDQSIAEALYTGIMTDTASFRFPLTTSKTHEIIGYFMNLGVNHAQVHSKVYDTKSQGSLQLLGTALSNMKCLYNNAVAYTFLTEKDLRDNDYKKGDTEGIVNYGLSLKGVQFAVIFIENKKENIIKISFRSKGKYDVNKFARKYFDGGGHINAAGGRSDVSLQKTITRFLSIIAENKSTFQNC
jgi:phosphoesterase RecJ-like protein